MTSARLLATLRGLPVTARDGLFAAAVATVDVSLLWLADPVLVDEAEAAGASLLAVAVLLLLAVPLAWRRRAPHAVLAAVLAATSAAVFAAVPTQAFAPLIALYTVAAHRPRRHSVPWLAAGALLAAVLLVVVSREPEQLVSYLVIVAAAWALGDRTRALRERDALLADRAARLEGDRERAAALAAAEERTRIARELHDVLAHSVSLMVVQAAGARRILQRDTARTRAAVAQVVATGEDSLSELRRMVGLLGDGDVTARPQPRLDDLPALVEGFRVAGVPASFTVVGNPRPVAAGVELSAYRIVQESLTNVLKHAGPGAAATVTLTYADGSLEVDVSDDGASPGGAPPAGHGIDGMRERALLHGGALEAGPGPAGGFWVRTTLPSGEVP